MPIKANLLDKIKKVMIHPGESSSYYNPGFSGPIKYKMNPTDRAIKMAENKYGSETGRVKVFEDSDKLSAEDNAMEFILNNPAEVFRMRNGGFFDEDAFRRYARNNELPEGYRYPRIYNDHLKKLSNEE